MTKEERELITDLKKCDFRQMDVYFKEQAEIRKAMSKEEKQKIKVIHILLWLLLPCYTLSKVIFLLGSEGS